MQFDWTTTVPAALGGVVFGAFLGGLIANSGGDRHAAFETRLTEAVAAEVGAATGALDTRLGALESALAGVGPDIVASVEAIRADVDASLATREEAQAAQLAALDERLASVATQSAPAAAVTAAPAPASDAAPAGALPGETAVLLDGAVRAFVSRVTDQGASVAVNGQSLITLAVGEGAPVAVGEKSCIVALDAVDQGSALLSADCAESASAAGAAAPSGLTLTAAAPVGIGQTALLADGKLKLFVSRIDDGGAVVAVGPRDTLTLALGAETAVTTPDGASCAVSLVSVADGTVELAGACAD